jgi:hypothetical protein
LWQSGKISEEQFSDGLAALLAGHYPDKSYWLSGPDAVNQIKMDLKHKKWAVIETVIKGVFEDLERKLGLR